jgi:hypothetical protein
VVKACLARGASRPSAKGGSLNAASSVRHASGGNGAPVSRMAGERSGGIGSGDWTLGIEAFEAGDWALGIEDFKAGDSALGI